MRDKNRDSFELRALQRVAQSGARALDLDVVLDRCLEQAVQVAGAVGGVIFLRDTRRGLAVKRVQHEMPDELIPPSFDLALVDAHVVDPMQIFDIDEVMATRGPHMKLLFEHGYRRGVTLRFIVDQRPLGFLGLYYRDLHELADSTRDTLLAMAAFEAVAIAAATVHAEVYERARVANL